MSPIFSVEFFISISNYLELFILYLFVLAKIQLPFFSAALTLLGEKTTLLSPEVIVASGIPCCRWVTFLIFN